MKLVNAVNYCPRRFIVDVAGVLDTPLKLVTITSLMKNCKIISKATQI